MVIVRRPASNYDLWEHIVSSTATYSRTHTTDSLLKKVFTLTHSTDSLLKKTLTLSHSTDSLLKKNRSKTQTTDSLLKKTATKTHTTDSLRKKTQTKTHTTDSELKKTQSKTHTTDSALKRPAGLYAIYYSSDDLLSTAYDINAGDGSDSLAVGQKNTGALTGVRITRIGAEIGRSVGATGTVTVGVFDSSTGALTTTLATINIATLDQGGPSYTEFNVTPYTIAANDVIGFTYNNPAGGTLYVGYNGNSNTNPGTLLWDNVISTGIRTYSNVELTGSFFAPINEPYHTTDSLLALRLSLTHSTDSLLKRPAGLYNVFETAVPTDPGYVAQINEGVSDPSYFNSFGEHNTGVLTGRRLVKVGFWLGREAGSTGTVVFGVFDKDTAALQETLGTVNISTLPEGIDPTGFAYTEIVVNHTVAANEVIGVTYNHSGSGTLYAEVMVEDGTNPGAELWYETNVGGITSDPSYDIAGIFTQAVNEPYHTTDSYLASRVTKQHTTNSLLKKTVTKTHSTDSGLKKTQVVSHSTDSELKKTTTKQQTTDSLLVKTFTKTHSSDSSLKKVQTLSHTSDSELKKTQSKAHSTDSELKKTQSIQNTTDSLLSKLSTLSTTVDSLLKKVQSISHSSDSELKKRQTLSHSTDSYLQTPGALTHQTDSLLKKTQSVEHSTDSYLAKRVTKSHTTNSLLKKARQASHSTDSLLASATGTTTVTLSHSTDSYLVAATVTTTAGTPHVRSTRKKTTRKIKMPAMVFGDTKYPLKNKLQLYDNVAVGTLVLDKRKRDKLVAALSNVIVENVATSQLSGKVESRATIKLASSVQLEAKSRLNQRLDNNARQKIIHSTKKEMECSLYLKSPAGTTLSKLLRESEEPVWFVSDSKPVKLITAIEYGSVSCRLEMLEQKSMVSRLTTVPEMNTGIGKVVESVSSRVDCGVDYELRELIDLARDLESLDE